MKLLTTTLPLIAFALLSNALQAAQPFDTSKELEIELSDRHDVSIDELVYFSRAAKRVFKDRGYTGKFDIDYYSGASQTDEGPLLDVQLIRWATWTPADFECRIYVTAISAGEKLDLGVFVGRADNFGVTTLQHEKRLIDSAAAALEKVYNRLITEGLIEKAE